MHDKAELIRAGSTLHIGVPLPPVPEPALRMGGGIIAPPPLLPFPVCAELALRILTLPIVDDGGNGAASAGGPAVLAGLEDASEDDDELGKDGDRMAIGRLEVEGMGGGGGGGWDGTSSGVGRLRDGSDPLRRPFRTMSTA